MKKKKQPQKMYVIFRVEFLVRHTSNVIGKSKKKFFIAFNYKLILERNNDDDY